MEGQETGETHREGELEAKLIFIISAVKDRLRRWEPATLRRAQLYGGISSSLMPEIRRRCYGPESSISHEI